MIVIINGVETEVTVATTIGAFLDQKGLVGEQVVVELNGSIPKKETWPETALSEGDRLEIIRFVGGG
jgi:thiamine biosynthesis protein ThiS